MSPKKPAKKFSSRKKAPPNPTPPPLPSDDASVTNLGWVRGQDHTNNEQTQSVMV